MTKKRILIISHDKIGKNMAGPGIRYHHMAELLAKDFDVTVGFFNSDFLPEESFQKNYAALAIDPSSFQDAFRETSVVISLWLEEDILTYCRRGGIFIVIDVYAPVPVENLALFMYSGKPIDANTDYIYRQSHSLYKKFFDYGDLFLFSNRRQLDFWMGYVFGLNTISVSSYVKRPVFDRFIYAPMGIDASTSISHTKKAIRSVVPGITEKDKVLLWTGGIWNWFDAQVLIRAMKLLEKTNPDIKLVFFGIKHPNPNIPTMQEATNAIALAKRLKLYNKTVFVQEGWVPYDERLNYLLEADLAINTAKESIEAEFSHRTRVLDHILTCTPTVATAGDYLSDEVLTQQGIGLVVNPNDEKKLAETIKTALEDKTNKTMRDNIKKVRDQYDWSVTLAPLVKTLKTSPKKLARIENRAHKDINKNRPYYRLAKKVIPKSIKKILIRVVHYGR